MDNFKEWIALLSVGVAFLAVFFGPAVAWFAAQRQVNASLIVANKQIIGPMRQAWINALRDLLAEFSSSALHYWQSGYEERSDAEYKRMLFLQKKISLMLNTGERDHAELDEALGKTLHGLAFRGAETDFFEGMKTLDQISHSVLKREWDRIKDPFAKM